MLEQKIQTKILKYLKEKGYYTVKTIVCSKGGVPDVLCCQPGTGLFVAFEVKNEHGETSPLQDYNIETIRKAGGKAYAVRSLEEVKELLE